ncbi:MAG: mechanosensitive ion channel domain-containing protein [Candidatus Micrarchaeota archaeon]
MELSLESLNEFLISYGSYLVLVIKIVVILLVGYVLGKVANSIIIRAGGHSVFGKRFQALGVKGTETEFGKDILELFGNLLKYTIYLASLVVVFDQLQFGIMRDMLVSLWYYAPNIIAAFVIIISGGMLGEVLGKIVRLSLIRVGMDELFKEAGQIFLPSRLFAVIVKYFIYLLAFTMALTQLGFQTLLLTIIVGSTTVIFTLFVFLMVAFGLKDMMPDMFSGMYLRSSGFIKLGESIEVKGFKGKVKNISLMSVTLEDGRKVLKVPNSIFLKGTKLFKYSGRNYS